MADDIDDHYRDSAYLELEAKISAQAIEEKKIELVQSYYLQNYDMLESPRELLKEANHILLDSPTSAFVIAYAVCEVVIRALILKPLIHGLVIREDFADLIVKKSMNSTRGSEVWTFSNELLKASIGVDLTKFSYRPYPEEAEGEIDFCDVLNKLSVRRNDVMHKAEKVEESDAQHLIYVAYALVEAVIPAILDRINLGIHNGKIIYRYLLGDDKYKQKLRDEHWAKMI